MLELPPPAHPLELDTHPPPVRGLVSFLVVSDKNVLSRCLGSRYNTIARDYDTKTPK
jgi:hypothetical protein